MLPDSSGDKQNDLAVIICKIEGVLEFDVALYPPNRDQMLYPKQYQVGNAAAVSNQYRA